MSQQTLSIEQYIRTAHNFSSYFKLRLVTLSVKNKTKTASLPMSLGYNWLDKAPRRPKFFSCQCRP